MDDISKIRNLFEILKSHDPFNRSEALIKLWKLSVHEDMKTLLLSEDVLSIIIPLINPENLDDLERIIVIIQNVSESRFASGIVL